MFDWIGERILDYYATMGRLPVAVKMGNRQYTQFCKSAFPERLPFYMAIRAIGTDQGEVPIERVDVEDYGPEIIGDE